VANTCQEHYFGEDPTQTWYGWIDIGYFRCRPGMDVPLSRLHEFPCDKQLASLSKTKIHYILVNRNMEQIGGWMNGLASGRMMPDNQISICGGCFLAYGQNQVNIWRDYFMQTLKFFVDKGKPIKDDQIIIAHCVFNDIIKNKTASIFCLHLPPADHKYDPWFYFTSLLLPQQPI